MPPGIKRTREIFIQESNKIHNYAYTYDKVVYIDNLTEVIITCFTHGDFSQLPKCHLRGCGCPPCSFISTANKKIEKSRKQFFDEITKIDNENRWDYSIAEKTFSGITNIVILICNTPGCFFDR